MAAWKRICCAIDFSNPSRAALLEAADLARRLGAELTLLHVHEEPLLASDDVLSSAVLLERAAEQLHAKLDAWRSGAERIARRPVRVALLGGDPSTELIRFVRAKRFDAVVVGLLGRGGPSRFVLGSIFDRVVRGAHCPVVVVHGDTGAQGTVAATSMG